MPSLTYFSHSIFLRDTARRGACANRPRIPALLGAALAYLFLSLPFQADAASSNSARPQLEAGQHGTATSALVVDVQRVLRESLAAQDVQKQLDAQRAKFQKETELEENELRRAEQDLAKSRERLDARTYGEREKLLRQRFLSVERHVEARRKALDATFTNSMNKVRSALIEVVEAAARAKGAHVVMAKQQILWVDPLLDATDDVLAKLNAKISHVPMNLDAHESQGAEDLPLQSRSMPGPFKRP